MNRLIATALATSTLISLPPIANASPRAVPVPTALQGRWAADFGPHVEPCKPELPDDFMWSFTADRTGFQYWEARATPTTVRQMSKDRFVVDLTYSGEGEVWHDRRSFRLANQGQTLFVDQGEPKLRQRLLRYRRCAVTGFDVRDTTRKRSIAASSHR